MLTIDPFVYAKGRLVIESRAAKRQPVVSAIPMACFRNSMTRRRFISWRSRVRTRDLPASCVLHPAWIKPCNRAFTPTEERLEFYRETRQLFAEGIARGTAAIPYPGTTMMIDVPVDERARITLDLWERCAARDAAKQAALARLA